MKRLPLNHRNYVVRRERDKTALVRLAGLLLCGLALASGFVFAAGHHFAAVRYGYKSEELRRERTRLLQQQSALLLAREQSTTPSRLETIARNIGMQPADPAQISDAKRNERNTSAVSTTLLHHAPTAFINARVALNR